MTSHIWYSYSSLAFNQMKKDPSIHRIYLIISAERIAMLAGQRIALSCPSLLFACSAGHVLSHSNQRSNELRLPSQTLASIQKKQFCCTANNRKGPCKALGTFTPPCAVSWGCKSRDPGTLLAAEEFHVLGAQGCRRDRNSLGGGNFWAEHGLDTSEFCFYCSSPLK